MENFQPKWTLQLPHQVQLHVPQLQLAVVPRSCASSSALRMVCERSRCENRAFAVLHQMQTGRSPIIKKDGLVLECWKTCEVLCPSGLLCVISGLLAGWSPGFRSELCCFSHMSVYGNVIFLFCLFALVFLAIPIHLMMQKSSSVQPCRPGLHATSPFCVLSCFFSLFLFFWLCFCLVFVWFCFIFGIEATSQDYVSGPILARRFGPIFALRWLT